MAKTVAEAIVGLQIFGGVFSTLNRHPVAAMTAVDNGKGCSRSSGREREGGGSGRLHSQIVFAFNS